MGNAAQRPTDPSNVALGPGSVSVQLMQSLRPGARGNASTAARGCDQRS